MTGKIIILPEYISNRIAAGEIIERPASVVRELLDNAIDAGAGRIEIEIEQGGGQLIRVTDNGSGFDPDGLLLAFERHATSKIKVLEDLDAIRTLGFRGEALPSIASVARVTVESFSPECTSGARLQINGGKVESMDFVACPPGSKLTIRNLFFNTPARRKFLKSVKTEMSQIQETVLDHALTHPSIHFILKDNGTVILDTPSVDIWTARIAALFGSKFMTQHFAVQGSHPEIRIQGVICHPEHLRSTGRSQRLFVNGRRIRDRIVTQAVYRGYAQFITGSGHPSFILRIDMPPDSIDVNVHPAKSEVRFRDSNAVFNLVSTLVAQTLSGSMQSRYNLRSNEEKYPLHASMGKLPGTPGAAIRMNSGIPSSTLVTDRDELPAKPPADDSRATAEPAEFVQVIDSEWQLVGQLFDTFILIEAGRHLLIIDQHTAHERLLFEKFKRQYEKRSIPSQSLLFPVPVELEASQYDAIVDFSELLRSMGLIIEPFGRHTFAVTALPEHIAQEPPELLLRNLADELLETGSSERSRVAERKMLVSLSCRRAVKAGDPMSRSEMEALVRSMIEDQIPNSCPHGRPIIVTMDHEEFLKRFKR